MTTNLISKFQDFLAMLQDDYGFFISLDKRQKFLDCAKDITNLNEFYFRSQSLICTSQEEVETYRSVFGQMFLGLIPSYGSDTKQPSIENKNKKPKKTVLEELEDQSSKITSKIVVLGNAISSYEKEEKALLNRRELLTKEIDSISENKNSQNQKKKESELKATPKMDDPAVKETLDDLQNKIQTFSSLFDTANFCGISPSKFWDSILRTAKQPETKNKMKPLVDLAMRSASNARLNKQMDEFKFILDIIKSLKDLETATAKTIERGGKGELLRAEKESRTNSRLLNQRMIDLDLLDSQWNQIKQNINRTKKDQQKAHDKLDFVNAQIDKEKQLQEIDNKASAPAESSNSSGSNQNSNSLVTKNNANHHRDIFAGGINAVQTKDAVAELLNTNLQRMSPSEKAQILTYIHANARVFKNTLRKLSACPTRRRIDIKRTIRAASRTYGEPLVVKYKEPKKSHAKVLLLMDISGSCRRTSTLALYFAALMNEAFPGGCKKFVFVNSLVPVDKYFRNKTVEDGVQAVLASVPTRGIYSNYGQAIHEFKNACDGQFHRDTTIIIIGDARNNKNQSAANDLKYAVDRCHKVYWLNTEPKVDWDTGDSVISQYIQAGAEAYHVETAGDLLTFLQNAAKLH